MYSLVSLSFSMKKHNFMWLEGLKHCLEFGHIVKSWRIILRTIYLRSSRDSVFLVGIVCLLLFQVI